MPPSPGFHSARLMDGWVVDMEDAPAALAALAHLHARLAALEVEVRRTVWGVQVRTAAADAVTALQEGYRLAA